MLLESVCLASTDRQLDREVPALDRAGPRRLVDHAAAQRAARANASHPADRAVRPPDLRLRSAETQPEHPRDTTTHRRRRWRRSRWRRWRRRRWRRRRWRRWWWRRRRRWWRWRWRWRWWRWRRWRRAAQLQLLHGGEGGRGAVAAADRVEGVPDDGAARERATCDQRRLRRPGVRRRVEALDVVHPVERRRAVAPADRVELAVEDDAGGNVLRREQVRPRLPRVGGDVVVPGQVEGRVRVRATTGHDQVAVDDSGGGSALHVG